MHPARRIDAPPIDNQRRGLDKAGVEDGDGVGGAEGNATGVGVAERVLSGRDVSVGVEVNGPVGVGTAGATSVATGETVGVIGVSLVVVAVARAVGVTVMAGSAVSVAVAAPVGVGTAVGVAVGTGSAVSVAVAVPVGVGTAVGMAVGVPVGTGVAVGGTVGLGVIVGGLTGVGAATITVPPSTDTDCVLAITSVTKTFCRFRALVPEPAAVSVMAANDPVPSGPALLPKLKAPKVTIPAALSMLVPTDWAVRPVLPRKGLSSTWFTVTTAGS